MVPHPTSVLKNGLEAVEKGRAIGAKTERERDWLTAIELYYKDYDKIDQTTRGLAYEKAMERLMQKYPDDQEAAIFYALALNETALPSDKTYAKQLKAGAILETVAATQPEHPGVVHYLIHTYDYPPLAQRGLAVPTNTPRSLPPPRTPSTCPRTPIRCSDYGRNQSSPIQRRGRSLRRWRPRRGLGQPTPASRTCWISWNTHSCKWARSNARSRYAMRTTQ